MPPLSRSWAVPVAGLVVLCAGCGSSRDPETRVAERAGKAVADLERLKPRLAKAGTPEAEALAANLDAVRTGLATLPVRPPEPVAPPPPPEPPAPVAPKAVRCPDGGAWRLGLQGEVAAWRVHVDGGGTLDDVGPAAFGLALSLERARPIDAHGEWSYGLEAAWTRQDRQDGQAIALVGLRPVIRLAVALSEQVAFTLRPLVEFGRASITLGAAPGGIDDQCSPYLGLGARCGLRWDVGAGGLTLEAGWRQVLFHGSTGAVDYRVEAGGPEAALGWGWRW